MVMVLQEFGIGFERIVKSLRKVCLCNPQGRHVSMKWTKHCVVIYEVLGIDILLLDREQFK